MKIKIVPLLLIQWAIFSPMFLAMAYMGWGRTETDLKQFTAPAGQIVVIDRATYKVVEYVERGQVRRFAVAEIVDADGKNCDVTTPGENNTRVYSARIDCPR